MPKLGFRNFEGVLESGGVVPHVEGYDPEFVEPPIKVVGVWFLT